MGKSYIFYQKPNTPCDPSLSQRILAFFDKLTSNDEAPGLHIEPVKNSADPRVRTGRVDLNHRALLFKLTGEQTSYVVHGIYPHDEAYVMAGKVRLGLNPINGMPSFQEVESVPKLDKPFWRGPAEAPTAPSPLIAFSATDLVVTLGIPPEVAETAVHLTSIDAMLAYAGTLPDWQGLALLGLAQGDPISEVSRELDLIRPQEVAAGQEEAFNRQPQAVSDAELISAFEHPASRMTFAKLEGADELRKVVLGGDFSAWQVFLHPQQRKWVEGRWNGAFRLTGGAGTGKTVVVVHRACEMARDGQNVIVTTFTKNLAADLEHNLRRLDPGLLFSAELGQGGVYVSGIDALASKVLRMAGVDLADSVGDVLGVKRHDIAGRTQVHAWQEALAVAGEALEEGLRRVAFLQAEYELVILPSAITTEAQYLAAARSGRGIRLARSARKAVWSVVEAYRAAARSAGTIDYAEAAAIAAAFLRSHPLPKTHVLVDEGQDFRPCHWQLVRALASQGPNDIFIAEDAHQRIYGHRVVLSNFGIETRGRSRKLRLNYRTTRQNLTWAVGVLEGQQVLDCEGELESMQGYVSARSGPPPRLVQYDSLSAELDAAARTLKDWLETGGPSGTIGVLVRDRATRDQVVAGLGERGVAICALETEGSRNNLPAALTMHRAKGMEFTKVLIFGVSHDSIPVGLSVYDYDQAEYDEALLRERSLLYVAATRARDELVITYSGERSDLLPN